MPLGHLLPKGTHIFKTAGAPWLARGSTSCLLDDFGQILWLLHSPPPLPRPSPRMQVALLCLSCSGTGASPKVGEGKEKAGRCRTPLPSAFVRHRFPSRPWEQLARRCSSSRAASSSPSARFGWCLSAPRSTPSFPPQSWSSLGWLQPGSTSQDTLATHSTFCLGVEEDAGPSAQAQGHVFVGRGVGWSLLGVAESHCYCSN